MINRKVIYNEIFLCERGLQSCIRDELTYLLLLTVCFCSDGQEQGSACSILPNLQLQTLRDLGYNNQRFPNYVLLTQCKVQCRICRSLIAVDTTVTHMKSVHCSRVRDVGDVNSIDEFKHVGFFGQQ